MKRYLYPLFIAVAFSSCNQAEQPAANPVAEDAPYHIELEDFNLDSLSNGHDFVDLGICNHLCWATVNVGAEEVWERGVLFSWGSTEPDRLGDNNYWTHYRYFLGSGHKLGDQVRLSKYNTNQDQYEEQDNLVTLQPEDDAAHVFWGGGWRMPDAAELDSLLRLCEWTPDTVKGLPGYRVSGKREGYRDHSIFLPNTGAQDGLSIYHPDKNGYYWSRNILEGNGFANGIGIITNKDNLCTTYYYRYIAQAVRPVFLPGEKLVEQVKVNLQTITLPLQGKSYTFHAQVLPANASNKRLYWASSDERVAKVDSFGVVTPQREGVCCISATSTDGTSCSSTCMVTVHDPNHPEHEYVDMGICGHLWWATVNVGAETPEEMGNYFDWEAAHNAVWGENWRLPTVAEIDSLLSRCHWSWTEQNGVPGYLVENNSVLGYRTTSLFFPAAGCFQEDAGLCHFGEGGYYWTNSDFPDVAGHALNLTFNKYGAIGNYNLKSQRCPIRMVYSTQ